MHYLTLSRACISGHEQRGVDRHGVAVQAQGPALAWEEIEVEEQPEVAERAEVAEECSSSGVPVAAEFLQHGLSPSFIIALMRAVCQALASLMV